VLPKIPPEILRLYQPLSPWESFYLRARWRLCPFMSIEALLPPGGKVLDFGCGYGMLSNLISLRAPSRHVQGVDLNRNRIAVAKRSAIDRDNIDFYLGDVNDLMVETFDAVVMTDVMHHLSDQDSRIILRKISSCLRPGGLLVILDVDRRPFWKFFFTYLVDRCLNPRSTLHYRSSKRMITLLKQFSFAVKGIVPVHEGLPLSDVIYIGELESSSPSSQ